MCSSAYGIAVPSVCLSACLSVCRLCTLIWELNSLAIFSPSYSLAIWQLPCGKSRTSSDCITPSRARPKRVSGYSQNGESGYRKRCYLRPQFLWITIRRPYVERIQRDGRRPHFNDLDLSITRISRSPDASIVSISEIMLGRPNKLYIFWIGKIRRRSERVRFTGSGKWPARPSNIWKTPFWKQLVSC